MSILKDIIEKHPIRRTDAQKEQFRAEAVTFAEMLGYSAKVETLGKSSNVIIGEPESTDVVITAHYDTPAASLFPNIMIPKNRALFYLYQFTPVLALLFASLGLGYLIGEVLLQRYEAFLVAFLVIYYGGFFLMTRVFVNKNNYNDNTSGVATVLSVAQDLGEESRKKVAFILFDNEEKGKVGSKAYFSAHKGYMTDKPVLNLDCVGNGENVIFIAKEKAQKAPLWSALSSLPSEADGYRLHLFTSKQADSNSDHKSFPCSIGCMACSQTKGGVLYAGRIHTYRDVVAKEENIEFLADMICDIISTL